MKFGCQVKIDVPRDFAVALFADKDHMGQWQPEFRSVEEVLGTPGRVGTKTTMNYQSGKHKFELIETVRVNELPERFEAEYETPKTCWNMMRSNFTELSEQRTLYKADIEYRMIGFMIKMIGKVMPGVFKKQTQKYLDNFKVFAERQYAAQQHDQT